MIAIGASILKRFDWVTYVFGAFLLVTAVKTFIARHDNLQPEKNPLVRMARRFLSVSNELDGDRFVTRVQGLRAVTPLFLVLLLVESSDLLFAVGVIASMVGGHRDTAKLESPLRFEDETHS